jgi:hypothetical protein
MPRFAVLHHDSPRGLHWDLLLEMGPSLKTWALPQPPEPRAEMTCDALPDHRLAYLDYTGPVSGERGSVVSWDRGTYEVLQDDEGVLLVDLQGERLKGQASLREIPGKPGRWQLTLL